MEIHQYTIKVLESHLDSFGHVNNATYLELFEEARWDFITSRHYGLNRIKETGLAPVVLEVNLKFHHELVLRQKITIETHFASIRSKIAIIHQEIKNEENKLCSVGDFKFAIFDLKARKIVTPTPEWAYAIGATTEPPPALI